MVALQFQVTLNMTNEHRLLTTPKCHWLYKGDKNEILMQNN